MATQEKVQKARSEDSAIQIPYVVSLTYLLIQRKFLATLTKEVADEQNPDNVRMLGAVVFKNFVANRGGVRFAVAKKMLMIVVYIGSKISRLLG